VTRVVYLKRKEPLALIVGDWRVSPRRVKRRCSRLSLFATAVFALDGSYLDCVIAIAQPVSIHRVAPFGVPSR
jgi:hypothetical protein